MRISGSRKRTAPARAKRIVRHVVVIIGALVMLYPLLWMLGSSLKPDNEIFSEPGLIPKTFQPSNYRVGWSGSGVDFGRYFLNSAFISGFSIVGAVLSCSLAGFVFARLRFRFKRVWFVAMLVTVMLPTQVVVIPQYILFHQLGWINTYLPLIVPHFLATSGFLVFLMVQFIRGIPRSLDESARIDGAGPFRTYWYIILPLLKPALVTTAIFTFEWTWNSFFEPLIYLNDPQKFTVPLGLRMFLDASQGSEWGPMLAMSTLSLIPIFVVFMVFQRLIVEGVATSGLKG